MNVSADYDGCADFSEHDANAGFERWPHSHANGKSPGADFD
jgi:hypothetical protein